MLYYLPLYYEAVKGYSPIISGVAVVSPSSTHQKPPPFTGKRYPLLTSKKKLQFPQTFTVAPMAMIIGFAVAITGYYRWALWTGWVFTVVGTGLLILLDVHTSTPAWIFLNLVPGAGTGILFSAMAYSIQASSPPKDQAFAASLYSFFRAFGQSLGVAIGGVIFQNEMKRRLLRIPEMAAKAIEYSKDSAALVQIIKAMPEDLPTRVQLIKAYAESLKTVWAAMCGFAAVALLFSLLVQHYDLDVQLETEQGYAGKKKVGEEAEEKA
jgi:hypothetical protein